MISRILAVLGLLTITAGLGIARAAQGIDVNAWLHLDHPAIQYAEATPDDPVARLGQRIARGEAKLDYNTSRLGYLASLLENLGINIDSQVLVFSKTSFQAVRISPSAPRALFFNDEVAVGSVQGGEVLELTSLDPRLGIVFYTLDMQKSARPTFDRRDVCLQCHQGPGTLGVPGIVVSSSFPSGDGTPSFRAGLAATDHRTPVSERWGGWYVTGTHGSIRHRGNAVARNPSHPDELESFGSQNLTSLAKKVDLKPAGYLTDTSDIVALMTLEHQTRMTNLITRVAWDTRIAEKDGRMRAFSSRLDSEIEELISYMFFTDEAALREPIAGVSSFTQTFPRRGPRDKQGRSLRDFDLKTRIFRYPLSYMIYSEAFDNMPVAARLRIYQRISEVLRGKDASPKFARLSAEDRRAIFEILNDTKPGWRSGTGDAAVTGGGDL